MKRREVVEEQLRVVVAVQQVVELLGDRTRNRLMMDTLNSKLYQQSCELDSSYTTLAGRELHDAVTVRTVLDNRIHYCILLNF